MNAITTKYCIRCLRRSCADCRVGDAVEASRMPEWDSASETHSYHPARQRTSHEKEKPWKFRLASIPGLHHGAMDWVWVRVVSN